MDMSEKAEVKPDVTLLRTGPDSCLDSFVLDFLPESPEGAPLPFIEEPDSKPMKR